MNLSRRLTALTAAGVVLPGGRLVHGEDDEEKRAVIWAGDGPATRALWAQAHAVSAASGLWPLRLGFIAAARGADAVTVAGGRGRRTSRTTRRSSRPSCAPGRTGSARGSSAPGSPSCS